MSQSISELSNLSDDELIALHDKAAEHTQVGVQFYLNEINRRAQDRQTETIVRYTRQMLWLTIFIAALTVVNVVAVIAPLLL